MKPTRCRLCNQPFTQPHYLAHICDECLDAVEERNAEASRELTDPTVKARIEPGVAKRLEE